MKAGEVNAQPEVVWPREGQRRHEMKLSGYIQKYFADRGFGFIAEHKNLHFFHITSCSFIPEVGQQVTFNIAAGRKGPAAVDVELVSGPTTPIASSEVSK